MRRITLQPIRRFAFLAVLAHVLLGGLLWWWLTRTSEPTKQTGGNDSLTWVSPADFEPPKPLPAPAPQPAPSKSEVSPTTPQPTPAEDVALKSIVAVAGTQSPPAPPPSKPLPKAIAIDPAQAMALMKAQEEASAPPPPAEAPKEPPAATPPTPTPPPVVAPPEPKPAPAPPPITEAPPPVSDVSRFITVTTRAPTDKNERLEEVDKAIRDAFMRQWMPPNTQSLNINQRTAHMDMTLDRAGHVLNFKLVKRSGSENFDLSLREAANKLNSIPVNLPASYPQDHYDFQLHFHVE